jgi:hypothetical protein
MPPPEMNTTVELDAAALLKAALPFMHPLDPEGHAEGGSVAPLEGAAKGGKPA